ncbi:thiamine pyrophosphate-binding protein [Agrococcus sp. ARC_14]|uniref:thiamine pyrophosphate-binding protein n=1 Tax=Agrococcus sp. ARC_14 TaxID=2919927 RepID=UPI001F063C5B|nr:thiamine pyrophosphate-binding protein [Agrococcus sp. ARC_14]MCH1883295.1 thiamine pyrophosphate-binding protein [Agrococcus sp. ARC_14]
MSDALDIPATSSVSAAIAAELEQHATDVFGLMGNGNAWFLDAVVRRGAMRLTTVRHETATVAAADAFYRASGRLAVATTTYGPGFTNAITALAEAAQARIPLVCVVGDQPTTGARPWDVDQLAVASAIGAATIVVGRDDARAAARHAVETALVESRPVVLAIPYDIGHAPLDGDGDGDGERAAALPSSEAAFVSLDAEQLAEVAELLTTARRPLLLAGRGAHLAGADDALRALAERLSARTASSALGSGIFSAAERHLGICGGFASERAAAAIEQADVVLVVGASLNQFQTRFGDAFAHDARILQVDVLPAATNGRVDELVRGDARLVAEALLALVGAEGDGAHADAAWADAGVGDVTGAHLEREAGDAAAPDGRLDPRSLFHALERILPADRVIVQDGGHFIGWGPTHLSVADPERLIMVGTAFQTIGLGFPSAVGAGAARPESTIVLLSGDGGALMGLADLDSVVRTVRHGVVIVVNDAAYGAEVHQYAVRGVAEEPMLIDQVDFAALGRGLGAAGAVIETLDDLRQLEAWLASGAEGVFVADCRVSQQVVAPYIVEIREAAMRAAAK